MNTAFPAKLELDRRTRNADVASTQRGKPERIVLTRIFLVAHPDPADLEQSHDRCQDFLPREPGQREIARDLPANAGQLFAEGQHPAVFGRVADLAPALMIAMLLSSPYISTCRLNVAVGEWTDPNVSPCRRDDEGADTLQLCGITDDLAFSVCIDETFAAPPPFVARRIIGDVTETRLPGRRE